MSNMDPDSLDAQIRKLYADLSATDRKLADVVIAHNKDLLGYTATELAHLAGVSKASAARFFRRLGYEDFNTFRKHIRLRVSRQSPLLRMDRSRAQKTALAQLEKHVQHDLSILSGLVDGFTDEVLNGAVGLLAQARRVCVVGYRNSYVTAFYASALLSQVRPDVCLLNEVAGREAELLAECSNTDVLVTVDFRRRASRLLPMVATARRTGVPVLLMTDTYMSALSAQADVVLHCPHHDVQMFDSYVSAISLVNYLATAVAAKTRKHTRVRMAKIESLHDALGDLEGDSQFSR